MTASLGDEKCRNNNADRARITPRQLSLALKKSAISEKNDYAVKAASKFLPSALKILMARLRLYAK